MLNQRAVGKAIETLADLSPPLYRYADISAAISFGREREREHQRARRSTTYARTLDRAPPTLFITRLMKLAII